MSDAWPTKLRWAISELEGLHVTYAGDRLILSAITQLQYLLALAEGQETNDSALEKIDIGYLAMYSLSDIISYDLSVALCDIADKVRRDLRAQGRHLNIDRH